MPRPRSLSLFLACSVFAGSLLGGAGCSAPALPDALPPAPPDAAAALARAQAFKEVRIVATDFGFSPRRLEVPAGRPVRFVLENRGTIAHDWVIQDPDVHMHAAPGAEAGAIAVFPGPGVYEVACTYPSHGQYGMTGQVVAVEGSLAGPRALEEAPTSLPPIPPGTTRLPLAAVAPPVSRSAPAVVDVTLEAREVVGLVDDHVATTFWTFGGTVPGPMVRVRVGDTVRLTLRNAATNKESHSIDFHAATGPGGGGQATQIGPGGQVELRFKALNPGVYVYHCATPKAAHHAANGMYGLIVVEPEAGWPKADREFYVMQGDLYLDGGRGVPGLQGGSFAKLLEERPDYVLLNGSVGALAGDRALRAAVGETVRVFFGVGGPNLASSFHVMGEIFDRVWPLGASEPQTNVQTTLVPPGGATLVDFRLEVPGTYMLIDHSLGRLEKGAAAHLMVTGAEDPDVFAPGPRDPGGHGGGAHTH